MKRGLLAVMCVSFVIFIMHFFIKYSGEIFFFKTCYKTVYTIGETKSKLRGKSTR